MAGTAVAAEVHMVGTGTAALVAIITMIPTMILTMMMDAITADRRLSSGRANGLAIAARANGIAIAFAVIVPAVRDTDAA